MDVLTVDNFDANVRDGVVLIDFFAEWCGPCHALAPTIEELAGQYQGKVKIFKVDVDEAPQVAARFQIMSIPTVMLFKEGEVKNSIVGAQPKSRYTDELDKLVA